MAILMPEAYFAGTLIALALIGLALTAPAPATPTARNEPTVTARARLARLVVVRIGTSKTWGGSGGGVYLVKAQGAQAPPARD